MPENQPKPKDLLSNEELIGFTRRKGSNDQVVRRASSAKVYTKSMQREGPEQVAVSRPPRPGGD